MRFAYAKPRAPILQFAIGIVWTSFAHESRHSMGNSNPPTNWHARDVVCYQSFVDPMCDQMQNGYLRTVNAMAGSRQFDMSRHGTADSHLSAFELNRHGAFEEKRMPRFEKAALTNANGIRRAWIRIGAIRRFN